ncbi:hypothetical protein ACH5RR_006533 [Cinchona calisaya]|uniref:Uncharacterized protein n=1 Tax=Cinchona calisaya TaxID=153742 RepID=A0ABD3AP91_9GENT
MVRIPFGFRPELLGLGLAGSGMAIEGETGRICEQIHGQELQAWLVEMTASSPSTRRGSRGYGCSFKSREVRGR